MNIGIFKVGALGDLLMATPLFHALRQHYPDANIDLWVGEQFKTIVEHNPHVEVHTFDANIFYKKRIFKFFLLVHTLRKQKYDMLIMLDRHWIFSLLARLTGVKERVGFDRTGEGKWYTKRVPYGDRVHETYQYLRLGKIVGCVDSRMNMELVIPALDRVRAERTVKQFKLEGATAVAPGGAVNPGQDMPSRRWPQERFLALVREISKTSKVVLVGGPADKKIADYISQSSDCTNLVGKITLNHTAAILQSCKCLITNDAGLMHVGAAVGCTVLAIFGPTDPVRKAPPGSLVAWHPMNLDRDEVYAHYSKKAKDNIKNVSIQEVLALWKKI